MKHELLIEKSKIIVSVEIQGVKDIRDFKFFLDTGSSITIISERVALRLGYNLKKLNSGDRLLTAGGGMNSKLLILPKFSLFGKEMVDFEVSVINLPLQITYFVDGLIGMDFLLQFTKIKFDFEEKTFEMQ